MSPALPGDEAITNRSRRQGSARCGLQPARSVDAGGSDEPPAPGEPGFGPPRKMDPGDLIRIRQPRPARIPAVVDNEVTTSSSYEDGQQSPACLGSNRLLPGAHAP